MISEFGSSCGFSFGRRRISPLFVALFLCDHLQFTIRRTESVFSLSLFDIPRASFLYVLFVEIGQSSSLLIQVVGKCLVSVLLSCYAIARDHSILSSS